MENITDLLDFEIRYTEDGSIEILDICNYPQESKKCFDLHKHLDLQAGSLAANVCQLDCIE